MSTSQLALLPDGWPALMSAALAARYLSMDEGSFGRFANRVSIAPVDIGEPLILWRKVDLDQAIKRLPVLLKSIGTSPTWTLDQKAVNAIVDAIAKRFDGQGTEKPQRLISIKEAGALLGLGRTTIYGLINDGKLTTHRLGRRTLIRKTDLDTLMGVTF